MNRLFIGFISVFIIFLLTSCLRNKLLDEMERIKEIGDENPREALAMLDSLSQQAREGSEYVQAKYDLLKIRLNDKAYEMPKSDIEIKRLMEYFEKEGSMKEKQEVYYYAGSVYRDLQDTPLALENFFKSLDYAEDNTDCDSIMLRNTYSNLGYLQYGVQNYKESVKMAEKELAICKLLKKDVIVPYLHMSADYLALDDFQRAKTAMDSAYVHIIHSKDISLYQSDLVHLTCWRN